MNLSPSRHPAFFAIACMSLLAAWSTPEADVVTLEAPVGGAVALGEAMPPTFKAPASLEADCIGHAGAQRALCVYAATRQATLAAPPPVRTASAAPAARTLKSAASDGVFSATKLLDDRPRSERSLLVR